MYNAAVLAFVFQIRQVPLRTQCFLVGIVQYGSFALSLGTTRQTLASSARSARHVVAARASSGVVMQCLCSRIEIINY
jgi:hypothetical protein